MLLFLLAAGRRLVAPRRSWCAAVGDLHLHEGCRTLPPMVQADGTRFGLPKGLVRPPSSDALWEWYSSTGRAARDPDPSWADVWDSAACLAQHVRATPADVQDKRVVELGSGLGVCGIAAALSGAKSVEFVDREPEALHCAMATAQLNGCAYVTARLATFGDEDGESPTFDVVLASDVLYDARDMEALAEACKRLAPRALIADPRAGRAEGARDAFVAAAKASGGRVIERDLAPAPEAPEPTMMLDVRWRQPSDQYADSLGAMIDGASSCCA